MAEFEMVEEIFEDAEEGFEDAEEGASEEMTEEEAEEFKEEVAEAKENVSELSEDVKEFKKFGKFVEALKSFGVFVAKNIAIGAIFFGVNIALTKLINLTKDDKKKKEYQRKQAVVKAITDLIKTETKVSKSVSKWLEAHKDDEVDLDGITVPLEAIFHKYLGPISKAVEAAFNAAKTLQKKMDGKTTWDVPNADDIQHLLAASEAFLTAFDDFRKFAEKRSDEFPVLKTLPLKQDDIDNIKSQIDGVKTMPFY